MLPNVKYSATELIAIAAVMYANRRRSRFRGEPRFMSRWFWSDAYMANEFPEQIPAIARTLPLWITPI